MSLYLVTLMPTLSAAMRLSRRAMMARPERLFTRFCTTSRVIKISTNPAVKEASFCTPTAPMGPLMMAVPSSARWNLSELRAIWKPSPSTPTYSTMMMFLMICPKARVTMAR